MKIHKIASPQQAAQQAAQQASQQAAPQQAVQQAAPQQAPAQAPAQQQVTAPKQQGSSSQLTPEENQILSSIRQKLLTAAPEIGDIMQNQRSKAILFAVLEALGNMNTGQIKSILGKLQQ